MRKTTISFVMSVCPYICVAVRPSVWNNSASIGRISTWHLSIFRKSVEQIQMSLNSDKIIGNPIQIYGQKLSEYFLEW
jgi:hypothetical protein